MIDFHSHILPQMDDGAGSVEESVKLIQMEREQGVDTICLTSHFYANVQSFSQFLEKRERALEKLFSAGDFSDLTFVPGAETFYYRGISENPDLLRLKFNKSSLLLLEMPFRKWSEYEIRELCDIAQLPDTRLLLAHFERYLDFNSLSVFENLLDYGALIQSNASFFEGFWNRRKALKLLKSGYIGVLGSDAHSVDRRPVKIGVARDAIEKSMGKEFLCDFLRKEEKILGL